jgi:hypothetical protein
MKEKGVDGAEVGGYKVAKDDWHIVEFQEGIGMMPGKGGEGFWQDEKGGHAWIFPIKVKDPEDESDGANIQFSANENGGGNALSTILAAVGMWDAICKKYPGDDVTVFDKPIMDGIKVKLPGMSCMCRSQAYTDKGGYTKAKGVQFASFTKYKEIAKEEKAKGKGKAESAPAAAAKGEDEPGW